MSVYMKIVAWGSVLVSAMAGAADAQSRIDAARVAAGAHWQDKVESFCGLRGSDRPAPASNRQVPVTLPEVPDWPEPAARIFDNLYFVGSKGVSAFAITTSEGIIVTDAMWAYDVERSVVGGLNSLGLDPKEIRYVIIPHGHPDHYGGANFLRETFGARIVAPRGDLEMIEAFAKLDTTPVPKSYDVLVGNDDTLTLGGTTVTFHEMPGHTPGGVVMTFPVADGGNVHRMLIWAAGGMTPNSAEKLHVQIPALRRLIAQAAVDGVDVLADNHGSHLLVEAMRANPGGGNPFLVGHGAAIGYLKMRLECDEARIAAQQ